MPRDIPLERIRNIGIMAHVDAGKTTVSERVLLYTGRIHRSGEVHDGTTQLDWTTQERKRGITITAASTRTEWTPQSGAQLGVVHRINLIDTPGHVDFTIEVERSLRVLDGAVTVFDASQGVEPQSETVWRQADRYGVPRIAFVNKMDKPGADFAMCLESIRTRLGANPVAVQLPLGEQDEHRGVIDLLAMRALGFEGVPEGREVVSREIPAEFADTAARAHDALVEACADLDDSVMERFLAGGARDVPAAWLERALRRGTLSGRLVPVLCGTALRNKGVQPLLDAIVAYLPSPADLPAVTGTDLATGAATTREADDTAPLAALAFKLANDPHVGHLTYVRVYAGTIRKGDAVCNSTRDRTERVSRVVVMHANERHEVDAARAGDIVALIGLRETRTGDTLCDRDKPVVLGTMFVPEPVVTVAIEPSTRADGDKLSLALARMALEDPSFRWSVDEQTGQTVLCAMGELHLEVLVDKLREEHEVLARTGRPGVAYRETIAGRARAEGRYVRQTGGPGHYGHVVIEVEPAAPGEGLVFTDATRGGVIPREFIPAVAKGIAGAMQRGLLAGYPVVDVRVALLDGSYHEVDSKLTSFEIAGSLAFQDAARRAGLVLLEPIMTVEVTTPEAYVGDVIGDLNARRGDVRDVAQRGTGHVIEARIPLCETFGYVAALRSRTQGRGASSLQFSHYASVPAHLRDALLARR